MKLPKSIKLRNSLKLPTLVKGPTSLKFPRSLKLPISIHTLYRNSVFFSEPASELRLFSVLVSPRWGDTTGNMAAANFTKNENTLTGGGGFFVATPFCNTKSTDLKAKTIIILQCVSS